MLSGTLSTDSFSPRKMIVVSEPMYGKPDLFLALAKRVDAHADIPPETKALFSTAAVSLREADCVRAMESLKFAPEAIHTALRAAAARDVADERRFNAFFEKAIGVSPNVPPGTTRH